MALIKCSECGNEVSDKAASCPKCGNPVAATSEKPERVRTAEDSALTRNRGCADLLVLGPIVLIVLYFIIKALTS